ncbi:hypothetical protein ACFWMS_05485 [Peribacillus butanolivorans]|uniref:hypothetical protein n=1 Tax=Peribacillus butanolivorans TaxID=421767 RepID=UPI003649067D
MSLPVFLPQDNKKSISEYRCIYSCLGRIEEKLFKGEFEEVKLSIQDLYLSITELEKMNKRKKSHDQMVEIVNIFSSRGINIELVSRPHATA